MSLVKEQARRLINHLPEKATWDDVMYEFYIKKKLSVALEAAKKGHVILHEEVKRKFLHQ
ncbi:MAG: hypothetical protein HY593_02990 [Candidatus Omnitrophica bacterium]|nr:hypothetical protein [Candidatus Omnitrophota bacterium]